MTDTVTTTRVRVTRDVVNRGYHARAEDLHAVRAALTTEDRAALRPLLLEWQGGEPLRPGAPSIDAMLESGPLDDEQIRFFGGALYASEQNHPGLFEIVEPAALTAPRLPVMPRTVEEVLTPRLLRPIAQAMPAGTFATWATNSGRGAWGEYVLSDQAMWHGLDSLDTAFPIAAADFIDYATAHPEYFRSTVTTTTTVPSGDSTVAPIGPHTPGWDAFWERVAEYAAEDGYQEQYNTLARAFGATEIDSEIEVDITVRVESFYVTIRQTMSRSQYDSGEYDLAQSEVDDEIRDHIRHNDVGYEVDETEVVG